MAQKLDADLNIIQRSDIEIQIDPLTKDLDIIQKLDDEPNDVGGLSAQQLKKKFDEAGNVIKEYINETLIPNVLGDGLTEQTRQENELVRQENEKTRQENEAARVQAEADREQAASTLNQELSDSVHQLEERIETAEAARNVWEDYDPQKNYVPGNKVYYLGSSYVNTSACKDVLPTVADNWQMIAKKGADGSGGMSQDEADLRYLQLSGGRMTGELRVQAPTRDDTPATKQYVDDAPPGGFRHMVIFQESGMFNPEDYGLNAGDIVSVTAVGGGGGGGAAGRSPFTAEINYSNGSGGDAGEHASMNSIYGGEGGFGYGAGGGGGGIYLYQPAADPNGGDGGWSGHVVHKVIMLLSAGPIPITVGAPGKGSVITYSSVDKISTLVPGTDGGTSSFGTYASAAGGTRGGDFGNSVPGNGYAKGGRHGDLNSSMNRTNPSVYGGTGGMNGSPGSDGGIPCLYGYYRCVSGGGGGGGYVIPFSALEVTTIGELVPGQGVVVVYW